MKSRVTIKVWKEHFFLKRQVMLLRSLYESKVQNNLSRISTLVMCGSGEKEIADFLGISLKTLKKYRRLHPELDAALNEKKNSDVLVMKAFFKRACGYTVEEESCEFKGKKNAEGEIQDEQVVKKTVKKDVPPDLNAIKWWLENCADKKEIQTEINLEEAREMLLAKEELEANQ